MNASIECFPLSSTPAANTQNKRQDSNFMGRTQRRKEAQRNLNNPGPGLGEIRRLPSSGHTKLLKIKR